MMNRYLKTGLIVTGIALLLLQTSAIVNAKIPAPLPASAAAPANDNCANAIDLTVNATCSFTAGTVDQATQSVAPSTCNGFSSTAAFDVWYKFVASPSGQTIRVKGSSSFDAVVILLDGCSGTEVDCSDNTTTGGTEAIQTTGLTAGNTYYIRVYHYGSALPTTPEFDICVSLPAPPPSNDDCNNAFLLTVDTLCNSLTGTVAGATQSGVPDSCPSFSSSSAYDVWYKFVATSNHNVIRVHGAQSFDAVVILKDSCSGSTLNCADASVSGGVEIIDDTTLIVGHTYYIRVYSYGSVIPSTPDFDICVSLPAPPPANNECSGAQLLAIDSTCNYHAGTIAGATQSEAPESCGGFSSTAAYDVWYSFVADSNDVEIKVKGSSSFDAIIALKDSCGAATIQCADATASGGTETIHATGLTPGHTYYVRVYDYGSAMAETPEFEICIALPPPPPANDECANAILLSVDSTCNYTVGSLLGATESGPADTCASFANTTAYDVWYKFVATASNNTVSVQGTQSFDAIVILKDSCSGSVLDCADDTYDNGLEVVRPNGLTVGNTYYVRVYAYGAAVPETPEFNICVSIPPPPPANDECANAITLTPDSVCTFVPGTIIASTQSGPVDACNGFTSSTAFDVWYKFVATATHHTVQVKGASSFDAIVILKDGCSGNSVACSDNTTTGGTETIDFDSLTVGNTYYVRVFDYGSSPAETPDFEICVQTPSTASINAIESKNNFVNIYPNPASNKITINITSNRSTSTAPAYRVMNISGQVVIDGSFATNAQKQEVDLSSLAPGIYNVQINVDNSIVNKKVVVMNK